jgi:hypothetical protein
MHQQLGITLSELDLDSQAELENRDHYIVYDSMPLGDITEKPQN